jgi:hypothetical protein
MARAALGPINTSCWWIIGCSTFWIYLLITVRVMSCQFDGRWVLQGAHGTFSVCNAG